VDGRDGAAPRLGPVETPALAKLTRAAVVLSGPLGPSALPGAHFLR
jgi:hypothetical protein